MPTLPIPFSPLNKSVDKPSIVFNQDARDGYWMEYLSPDGPQMIWAKRPGLTLFCDINEGTRIDGVHYWVRQQKLIAVTNGKVFIVEPNGSFSDVTGSGKPEKLVRPTFTDILGSAVYFANSGKIIKVPSSGTTAYIADTSAPTSVRFVGALNKKLVALNDGSEQCDWSEAGDPDNWTGQFASVEGQPDIVRSMKSSGGYLYFHGQSSIEVWRDDGITFIREGQGAIQRGCSAPYSVVDINGTFFWLDDNREVCTMTGFTLGVVSNPALSRYLRSFGTVSDALGDYLKVEGRHFYVLTFPNEEKTLVYDIGLKMWYEWGYWDSIAAEYDAWRGFCVTDATDWGKVLVGDRGASKIYEVSGTTDAGDTIRTMLVTDQVDRGSPGTWKVCHELTLRFKRADTAYTPKTMVINYRDDGATEWSDDIIAPIEAAGKTDLVVNIRRLGKYKTRIWRFVLSDASQAAMISAVERFEYATR